MEMDHTTFDWTLNYDEIDYIIEGTLSIIKNGKKVTAGPGEIILIPHGSSIQFQVEEHARFLYITYPADWANTTE
ncbi:Ethanolamine utilization protein eutQ [uncultured Roseburia sp.]|uniref:cupin domain-containing protein n=1 Tax=Brotonthovivens ammoniilytica TaxID=2981725 RepID=UPI00082090E5|nr:Ethanolamine utilization protein eutQ [uncultured Roseburia sp.]